MIRMSVLCSKNVKIMEKIQNKNLHRLKLEQKMGLKRSANESDALKSRSVLDFLENPVKADNEIIAVHDEANPDKYDEYELVVADPVTDASFMSAQIRQRTSRSRDRIVP